MVVWWVDILVVFLNLSFLVTVTKFSVIVINEISMLDAIKPPLSQY